MTGYHGCVQTLDEIPAHSRKASKMADSRKTSKRLSVSRPSSSEQKLETAAEASSIYPVRRLTAAPRRPSQAPAQSSSDAAATNTILKRASAVPPVTTLPVRKVSFSQESPRSTEPDNANVQKRTSSRPSSAELPRKSATASQQPEFSQVKTDQVVDQSVDSNVQKRSLSRPSSAELPIENATDFPQAQSSEVKIDRVVDQVDLSLSLVSAASKQLPDQDRSKELEEIANLRQQVEDGKNDVVRLVQQVADKDKEIDHLKQQLKAQPEVKAKVKAKGEVKVEDSKDLEYSLEPFLKCQGCGRPNLCSQDEHPLLRATEDSKWLAWEIDALEKNKQLYSDIEHKLLQIKDLVEQNQLPDPGTFIEPFFQPKQGTDVSSFWRARDPNLPSKLSDRDFSKGKRGDSFEIGLIYTDCSQMLDVLDPPAVLAIEEIPSLMRKEIDEFLTSRGLRDFDSATYNWFVIPGLPLNQDARTFTNFTNAAVVIYPKDQKLVWNNKMLNSQLRYYLHYLAGRTDELVQRLRVHEDCMEAFWHERSYFNQQVLSKELWPEDAKSERGAQSLIANMLTRLRKRVAEREAEVSKLRVQLQASGKRGDQYLSSLQEAKALLVKKDEAVAYYNHALQTCRGQVKTLQSQSEETEGQILALKLKLQAMAEPMCKIWTTAFLESVRRKVGQELSCAFADVIPALEDRSHAHVMRSWNATLSKIYENPDACALLASKGLHQDLLELTRVGAHHRDGQQTLQHLGAAAATIANKAQIAEAISSLDLEETRRNGLMQLYRYLYGADSVAENDRKGLVEL